MIKSPAINEDGLPALDENEEILHSWVCQLSISTLSPSNETESEEETEKDTKIDTNENTQNSASNELISDENCMQGTFYITSQALIWIMIDSNSNSNVNESISMENMNENEFGSFYAMMTSLVVHAFCKDCEIPFLFLQLDSDEANEIRIIHENEQTLEEMYSYLCEAQRMNPCEDQLSEEEKKDSAEKQPEISEHLLQLFENLQTVNVENKIEIGDNLIVHDCNIDDAEIDGQFEDAEGDGKDVIECSNPYFDATLIKECVEQFSVKKNKEFEQQYLHYKKKF